MEQAAQIVPLPSPQILFSVRWHTLCQGVYRTGYVPHTPLKLALRDAAVVQGRPGPPSLGQRIGSGRDRQFALEDAGCAGRFVDNVSNGAPDVLLNDAAQACALIDRKFGDHLVGLFDASEHGRLLRDAGFGHDLDVCAAVESAPVIPLYQDRQITRLGPDRER